MPTMWWSRMPKWKVRSRPPVKPPSLNSSWRNSRSRSTPRVVKTPRLRCSGRIQSSSLQRGGDADADRLLTDAGEPLRQLALPEQAEHLFFDQARQQQRAVERMGIGCGNHEPRRLSYTRAVKSMLMLAALADRRAVTRVRRSRPRQITVMLDARTEGRATRDETATRLLAEVRRGLEAIGDVEVVEPEHARRTIWIVTGATPGSFAASVIVTERYDRETLMVLGIEDDDMAHRMMALQIVVDHQIFTGRDPAALAQRIVTAVNDGLFARLRTLKPKP